jgi:hypothetical protein
MADQIKGMTEEQLRQFFDYIDSEEKYLEKSRQEWISAGRLELAGNDKLELARLRQTKSMFLKIMQT